MKYLGLNNDNLNTGPASKYVNIDGQLWAVPIKGNYVFQCHRGFWFEKNRKPEIVTTSGVEEWTPEKRLLQYRNSAGFLMPLKTAAAQNWRQRVFLSAQTIKKSQVIDINCNVG
jgi:hypothetical protein